MMNSSGDRSENRITVAPKSIKVMLTVTPTLNQRLENAAGYLGISRQSFIETALLNQLTEHERVFPGTTATGTLSTSL